MYVCVCVCDHQVIPTAPSSLTESWKSFGGYFISSIGAIFIEEVGYYIFYCLRRVHIFFRERKQSNGSEKSLTSSFNIIYVPPHLFTQGFNLTYCADILISHFTHVIIFLCFF